MSLFNRTTVNQQPPAPPAPPEQPPNLSSSQLAMAVLRAGSPRMAGLRGTNKTSSQGVPFTARTANQSIIGS